MAKGLQKVVKGHKLKKNKNYTKKHRMSAKDILAKDLIELESENKETLRKALVVVNQARNKEVLRISRLSTENKQMYLHKNPMLQDRISINEKGKYARFSTWPSMTKPEIIQELIKAKTFFDKTPTPQQLKEQETFRDKIIKDYIREYNGVEYDYIEGRKPTLKKLGKLLQRLEDNHKISAHAGTSGYSLGSETAIREAFKIAFERPQLGIAKLYEEVEKTLKDLEENQKLQEKNEDDMMSQNYNNP